MDYNKIISLCLEIEGLARLLNARESNDARDLLKNKVSALATAVQLQQSAPVSEAFESQYAPIAASQPLEAHNDFPNVAVAQEVNVSVVEEIQPTETKKEEPAPCIGEPNNETVRVEDIISQQGTRDFSKAFSINDKYRFIREIFNNNVNDFNTALNRVATMTSLNEAYDYFLNELGWEADEEAVAEFLQRVANHFNAVQ